MAHDTIGVSNYSASEVPTLILGTKTGVANTLGTGLYAVEGNWYSDLNKFIVTSNNGGTNGTDINGTHTYATMIVEGNHDTLTNNQSIVLLIGVHDNAFGTGNFTYIPGGV